MKKSSNLSATDVVFLGVVSVVHCVFPLVKALVDPLVELTGADVGVVVLFVVVFAAVNIL